MSLIPCESAAFHQNRLHSLLQRQRLGYTTAADGTCFVEFSDDRPIPLVVCLSVTAGPAFSLRAFLPCVYSAAAVPVLLATLNRWHSEERWPRAYVVFDDPRSPDVSDVVVYADAHFPLGWGASDEQLEEWLWIIVRGADALLTRLDEEASASCCPLVIPTAEELDSWLKRT